MTAKDGYSKEPKWPRFLRVGLLSAIILTNQQQPELRAQPSSIEWTVDGCELSVSFPYQYREYETIVHRPPNYVPAKLHGADTTNNGLLRAECGVVPRSVSIEHMREESFLLAMMEEIGNGYALNLRTYSITEFGGKPVAKLFLIIQNLHPAMMTRYGRGFACSPAHINRSVMVSS